MNSTVRENSHSPEPQDGQEDCDRDAVRLYRLILPEDTGRGQRD